MTTRTRYARVLLAGAAALLVAAACTPAAKTQAVASEAPVPAGTIEFWHFFTDREATAIEQVIADFTAKYPQVKVEIKSGQDDTKTLQAIGAGQGPDVALSYSTDIVGKFCSSGAWVDLKPYIDRNKIDPGDSRPRSGRTPSLPASDARCRSSPARTASTTTRRCSPTPGSARRRRPSPS